MYVLRRPILAISATTGVRDVVSKAPVTRDVVKRFVAGETVDDATSAVTALRADGLLVTLDHLGEDTTEKAQADATVAAYLDVIDKLTEIGSVADAEVSVKLSAVGQALPVSDDVPEGGEAYALAGARRIADAAYAAGARVTLDMEDHTTVDSTLRVLRTLRKEHPDIGIAIQAMLKRTPSDLAELVGPGSRVRLVKGAYHEPETVAFVDPGEVDLAYVRCLRLLMAGHGRPMVASHDPRIIAIAERLAADAGRAADTWEYQMLYGIRPDEQRRLARAGHPVRIYVAYGHDWWGYFTRRLAERPANLLFFLRSMVSKG
jgi:proline dehydrogenase